MGRALYAPSAWWSAADHPDHHAAASLPASTSENAGAALDGKQGLRALRVAAQRRAPPRSPARPASRSHAPAPPQPCLRRRRLLAIVPLRPVHASHSAPPLRGLLRLCELAAAWAQRVTTPPRHTSAGRSRHYTPRPTMRTALAHGHVQSSHAVAGGGVWPRRRRGTHVQQAEGAPRAAGEHPVQTRERERSHGGCQSIGQQSASNLVAFQGYFGHFNWSDPHVKAAKP
jgi:hypothetical protein